MCGIVGYIGQRNVTNVIMVGLERLEYRGCDSCGIAITDGGLEVRKTTGRLKRLQEILDHEPLTGTVGVGHTRWATHGRVTTENAHPFTDAAKTIALVHNGVIENYRELRVQLQKQGIRFSTETDTEVAVHLIASYYRHDLGAAIRRAVRQFKGMYSLAVVSGNEPDRVWAVRAGSPLVIGRGPDEFIFASDAPALVGIAQQMLVLQDGEIAVLTRDALTITDFRNRPVERRFGPMGSRPRPVSKGRHAHFMRKEIAEQPRVIAGNIARRFQPDGIALDPEFLFYPDDIERLEHIVIQACGTSWHAGLVARHWFEDLCGIPVTVEVSSELRAANCVRNGNTIMLAISQSGETADTLAALRSVQGRDIKSLAVLNSSRSAIDREVDSTVYIHAGPEIGVASTKAYTAQLFTLLTIALYFARIRKTMPDRVYKEITARMRELPRLMKRTLTLDRSVREAARQLYEARDFLFLGRGLNYPTALEGALKLKETTYVHATGYPAGELKHGPIALIDEGVPVICIAPRDSVYEKMITNVAQAKARKGRIIAVGTRGDRSLTEFAETVFLVPETHEYLTPLLTVLPLQLLAYNIALLRGVDVDNPRSLAKAVTVE